MTPYKTCMPRVHMYRVRLTHGDRDVTDHVQATNVDEAIRIAKYANNFPDGATSETQRTDK